LFFSANPGTGNMAYSTDGTAGGTADLGLGTGIFFPKEYNGKLYFIKTTEDNAMYEFDGTNIQRVINNGTIVENVLGGVYTVLNGKALLYMKNNLEDKNNIQGTEVGVELYEYDFSSGLYTLIKNIAADDLSNTDPNARIENSGISNMVNLGTKVYFEAESVLWETDGTTDGTIEVSSATSIGAVMNFYVWNDKLFFEGDDGTGDQLWVYDPALGTTTNISNISGTNTDHDPSDYCPYGGYLYYRGEDAGDTDGNLFRTDGTTIEQIDNTIIDIDEIVELNGILYFEGDNGTSGNELFMLDPATIPTAIGDVATLSSLTVYPNPSNGTVNIKGLETADATYCIYSLTGQCVAKGNIVNNQLSYNKAGMYILQIMDGTSTLVQKITIK